MGEWNITIQGHGIHDNHRDDDADAIYQRFLAELQISQEIQVARFTVGSSRDMLIQE